MRKSRFRKVKWAAEFWVIKLLSFVCKQGSLSSKVCAPCWSVNLIIFQRIFKKGPTCIRHDVKMLSYFTSVQPYHSPMKEMLLFCFVLICFFLSQMKGVVREVSRGTGYQIRIDWTPNPIHFSICPLFYQFLSLITCPIFMIFPL